jgi:hypothetical protein
MTATRPRGSPSVVVASVADVAGVDARKHVRTETDGSPLDQTSTAPLCDETAGRLFIGISQYT